MITVNNYPSPTTSVTAPTSNASVSGTVGVTTANTVAGGLSVSKVEFYVDYSEHPAHCPCEGTQS